MSVFSEIKSLILKSIIYGSGSLFLKAVSFFLLPIYTRLLDPSDYGVWALSNVVSSVVSIFISFSIHGFVPVVYFHSSSENERREGIGTIFVTVVLVGGLVSLLLDQLGSYLFSFVIRDVPFHPYLRIAIWTTYFNSCGIIPLRLLQMQERSLTYVLLTVSGSILQTGLSLFLALHLGGVNGLLIGYLIASLIMLMLYLTVVFKDISLAFKKHIFCQAMVFSAPLILHELSGWILELSDRVILQWYVSLDQVGIYSLAYSYGSLMSLVAYSINIAWVPMLFRVDAEKKDNLPVRLGQLGTYFALILCLVGAFLGLMARPIITMMTSPLYHKASEIAPWIVLGLLLSGLYYFPVNFLFLRKKTVVISLVMILTSLINISLNFWMVPLHGAIAAAWTTCISYGVMLILICLFSFAEYPIVYEYRRLSIVFAVSFCLWVFGHFSIPENPFKAITVVLVLIALVPVSLLLLGFFSEEEKRFLIDGSSRALSRLRT